MPVMQGHFGNVPEGLYDVPAVSASTSLVLQKITRIPQPQVILDALEILQAQGSLTPQRVESIRTCDPTQRFTVVCAGCGTVASIRASGCNSRLCLHCGKRFKGRLFNRLYRLFEHAGMLRHLVIGFVNVDHISVEYFKQCSYAFDLFKKFLKSQGYTLGTYACVLEVKYHKAGEPIIESGTGQQIGTYQKAQWNVHYHVLFQGDYIPQKVAQEMFKKATKGESFYTFIKACTHQEPIQDKQKAIRYVCSYLGKVEGHNGDPAVLAEFYAATLKIRFYKLSIQKKDRTKRQKLKLTCTYCNGQHWITPFQEPKYWEQLTARIVPDEHAACLKPTHPTPVVTIHEDETIAVTYDENNTANRVQYSRKSLLERLGEPQSLATLCVHYSMSEEALRAELGALAVRGDIVELPRRLWARVR